MSSIRDRQIGMQGRWFILVLLLTLASALVPALCSHGPPNSRLLGSAFDPTTSMVALRGRASLVERPAIIRPDDGGGNATAAGFVSTLPTATLQIAASLVLSPPAADAVLPQAPRETLRRITPAQPRAPPPHIKNPS